MNMKREGVWNSVFIVMGQNIDIDFVVKNIAIVRSASWKKGEINPESGQPYDYESVTFEVAENLKGGDLIVQLSYWVDTLWRYKKMILELKNSGCDLFIECWIVSNNIEGIDLTSGILKRLAQLNLDLEIRFHPY